MDQQRHVQGRAFALLALVAFARCVSAEQQSMVSDPSVSAGTPAAPATPTPAADVSTVHAVPEPVLNATTASIKPVQIDLFYEALCSDTVDFVKFQLLPVYRKFNKYIDVTFIPFAQGKFNDDGSITCHRDGECVADCVHACGISKISDKDKLIEFLNCALEEGFKYDTIPLEKCGENNKIEADIINLISKCANDKNESYAFLKNYKKLAVDADVINVPKIIINKKYSEEIQKLSLINLKKVVCDKIPNNDSLSDCKEIISGSATVVVGILPILIGVYYFIRMF